jgi:6-phosphogluconolactonase (cycloisomerase 2 family)
MSDTHIVVGAQGNDDSGSMSGSAYIYNLDGTGEVKITASDAAADDRFGWSVAISDTKVTVGARNQDNATGAVYVYNTDGTGELKILASDATDGSGFGFSVAATDTKIVVGASQADIIGSNSGSVYVYNTDGTGEQKIMPSDGADSDQFGRSVAIN